MKENLYDTNREYWMDIQLNTGECFDCNQSMNPMQSVPIKNEEDNTYKFICRNCHFNMETFFSKTHSQR